MITKAYAKNGRSCRVTFQLPAEPQAQSGAVLGEFNDWNPEAHRLKRSKDGGLSLAVSLPAGRRYRFRYLLDGERWSNDEAADAYVPNHFGSLDAVLDLAGGETAPAAAPRTKAAATGSVARPKKAAKPAAGPAAKPAAGKMAKPAPAAGPEARPAERRRRPRQAD